MNRVKCTFYNVSTNIVVAIFSVNVYWWFRKPYIEQEGGSEWRIYRRVRGADTWLRKVGDEKRFLRDTWWGEEVMKEVLVTVWTGIGQQPAPLFRLSGPSHPTRHLRLSLYKASYIHNRPEDGSCIVCRNAEKLQNSTRLIPESQNYTLYSSRENLRTKNIEYCVFGKYPDRDVNIVVDINTDPPLPRCSTVSVWGL